MDLKQRLEVAFCEEVARVINQQQGTEYRAEPAAEQDEIHDVILRSIVGGHEPMPLQVVTIPIGDIGSRLDTGHRKRLQEQLPTMLQAEGLRKVWVNLVLNDRGIRYGLENEMVKSLVNLIVEMAATGGGEVGDDALYERGPELADRIGRVAVTHVPTIAGVRVGIPMATYVPRDERWIVEGIQKKLDKYGGTEQVKDLILVVGDFGVVDREQIDVFRQVKPPERVPFRAIWLVSRMEGVHLLKPGQGSGST
jgi:hypothetical protein